MATPKYQYESLDVSNQEIRVLHIQPGAFHDPISCALDIVSLVSTPAPEYEGLSYVWGDPTIAKPIIVEGCEFQVTTNLFAALRRLRCRQRKRIIWIDAICINQEDLEERKQQVILMGKIYGRCEGTWSWLGDWNSGFEVGGSGAGGGRQEGRRMDEKTIEEAMCELMGFLEGDFEDEEKLVGFEEEQSDAVAAFAIICSINSGKHLNDLPWFLSASDPEGLLPDTATTRFWKGGYKAMKALFDAAYWTRIWIVQEIILSPSVRIALGSTSMPWRSFLLAAGIWFKHAARCCLAQSTKFSNLGAMFGVIGVSPIPLAYLDNPQDPPDDLTTILSFVHRQATNPLDKVYALLGVLGPDWRECIKPDYTVAKEDVFSHVTARLINDSGDLKPLLGHQLHQAMPTWIVDWSETLPENVANREKQRAIQYGLYDASRGSIAAVESSNRGLKLVGVQFDTIKIVGSSEPETYRFLIPTYDEMLRLADLEVGMKHEYAGGGTWEDAYWRVLRADVIAEMKHFLMGSADGLYRRLESRDKLVHEAFMARMPGRTESVQESLFILTSISNRRPFITKSGYLGMGPSHIQPGHEIYVLNGSRVPFALRRIDNAKDSFGTIDKQINRDSPDKHGNNMEETDDHAQTKQGKQTPIPRFSLVGDCYVHGIMDGEAAAGEGGRIARPLILC